jgi:hypothetical protein
MAGSLFLPSLLGEKEAYAAVLPKRLVVMLSGHGPVTGRWQMHNGLPETAADWEYPLNDPNPTSFSKSLRPLHPYRQDLLILDGLAMTSAYADPAFGNAHVAAGKERLAAHGGGGGPSVDQLISAAVSAPGSFPYLYYVNWYGDGDNMSSVYDTAGNQVGPARLGGGDYLGQAFDRVFGGLTPTSNQPKTPPELSRYRRPMTLDLVKGEYTKLLGRLSAADRDKLTRHRDMVANLEQQAANFAKISCNRPTRPGQDWGVTTQVAESVLTQLYPVAMACNLTQVALLDCAQLYAGDIGAPSTLNVHSDIAHDTFTEPKATWMENYYAFHAQQFADMIAAFKAVPEGTGTMLDNSLLLWMPELANGLHDLYKLMVVMAGGAGGSFRTGRYIKYQENNPSPKYGYNVRLGPPHSKLLVSILQAFGVNQSSIGIKSAPDMNGGTIDFTGPLPRLT